MSLMLNDSDVDAAIETGLRECDLRASAPSALAGVHMP
jgi:hypothetical protein